MPNGSLYINPVALRMAKTLWSFGHSDCNRVNGLNNVGGVWVHLHIFLPLFSRGDN